jgi:thiamine pyrophosphate-dependent acetolactate synthase large subunit-like protein
MHYEQAMTGAAAEHASLRAGDDLAMPKLTSSDAPLSPYRVLWDLQQTVDVANTIITHDAGSPRDHLSPFWRSTTPLSYLGWGKTTQLGYGLGLAMGDKLAKPDKLCAPRAGKILSRAGGTSHY